MAFVATSGNGNMMSNTTLQSLNPTVSFDGNTQIQPPAELLIRYEEVLASRNVSWTAHLRMERVLGKGGQGVVFFSNRRGADGFTLPIALKVFSPERYEDVRSYDQSMGRIARVASHIAQIQHDNLLDVQDFYDRNRIRIMAMEWVDGYDLRRLLDNDRLAQVEGRVSSKRWADINRMVVTEGPYQPRVKPGVAVAIVRDCLSALAALHREEIVHGDIKPGNIMLKLTGRAKIIDMGSAFEIDDPPQQRSCTPTYAAPEVLEGEVPTRRSDLASLGYVLIELMAGKPLFSRMNDLQELLEAKRVVHQQLEEHLPEQVTCNELLMNFCRRLVAPDPALRFPTAEDADLFKGGAAAFHRQLVLGDLAVEYSHEIHLWLQVVKELEEIQRKQSECQD